VLRAVARKRVRQKMALLEPAFSRDGSWFRFIRSLNRRIVWLASC